MCQHYGIKHTRTSAYNPQGNDGVERFNRTLKDRLRRFLTDRTKWRIAVTNAVEAYRMTPHSSVGCSPYEKTFGRAPVTRADRLLSQPPSQILQSSGRPLDHRQPSHRVSVGQKVWVRNNTRVHKLDAHWLGPYRVHSLPSPNAVQLEDDHGYRWVVDARQVKVHVDRKEARSSACHRERRRPSWLQDYATIESSGDESDSTLPAVDDDEPTTRTGPPSSLLQVPLEDPGDENGRISSERECYVGPPEGEVCKVGYSNQLE